MMTNMLGDGTCTSLDKAYRMNASRRAWLIQKLLLHVNGSSIDGSRPYCHQSSLSWTLELQRRDIVYSLTMKQYVCVFVLLHKATPVFKPQLSYMVLLSYHPIFHFLKLVSFLGANRTRSASVWLWLL